MKSTTRPVRAKYSHAKADAKKERKRKEHEARMKVRRKRTDRQQLAKLDSEGWAAKKERARLGEAPKTVSASKNFNEKTVRLEHGRGSWQSNPDAILQTIDPVEDD